MIIKLSMAAGIAILFLAPFPSRADIAFSAKPMLGDRVKSFGFLPVRIELRTTQPFRGAITAQAKARNAVRTEIDIRAGPGTFRYELPIAINRAAQAHEVVVSLCDERGRLVDEKKFAIQPFGPDGQGMISPLTVWADTAGMNSAPLSLLPLSRTAPEDLPEEARLYAAIDLLILPGSSAAAFSTRQADAVAAWIHAGGRVLVDSAVKDQQAETAPFFKLFNIQIGDQPRPIAFQDSLLMMTPEGLNYNAGSYNMPSRRGTTNTAVSLTLSFNSIRMNGAACMTETNLSAQTSFGLGRVIITPLDLKNLFHDNTPAAADALLFRLSTIVRHPAEEKASSGYPSYYGEPPPWCGELFIRCRLEPIPPWAILTCLLLFMGLVGPLERVVLARRRWLAWTWITTAALVVVFSLLAGTVSIFARDPHPRRAIFCIYSYASEGGGRHLFYECFIPSRSQPRTALLGPTDSFFDLSLRGQVNSVIMRPDLGLVRFSPSVWSPYCFAVSRFHKEPAPFHAELRIRNGKPEGTVTPLPAGPPCRHVWLLWNGTRYDMRKEGQGWRVDAGTGQTNFSYLSSNLPPEVVYQCSSCLDHLANWTLFQDNSSPGYFFPLSLPRLAETTDRAVVLALTDAGPIVELDAPEPKLDAIRVIQQEIQLKE